MRSTITLSELRTFAAFRESEAAAQALADVMKRARAVGDRRAELLRPNKLALRALLPIQLPRSL